VGNNLTGDMSVDVGFYGDGNLRNLTFFWLQSINVENNNFTGRFPLWITQLPNLNSARFINNTFVIVPTDEAAMAEMCARANFNCTGAGVPGYGSNCQAFGDDAVLLQPWQENCYVCTPPSTIQLQYYTMAVLPAFVLIGLYIAMVHIYAQGGKGIKFAPSPHPTSLKGWVTCSCIIILHMQTIMLICNIRPFWPASVRTFMSTPIRPELAALTRSSPNPLRPVSLFAGCLALDYSCFTKPECMVDLTPTLTLNLVYQADANTFLLMMLLVPPCIIFILVFVRAGFRCKRRRDLEKGIVHSVSPDDSAIKRIAERSCEACLDLMPDGELVCSIVMVCLLAHSLRAARQLIVLGESVGNGDGTMWGVLSIVAQPAIYILYGRDAVVAQRARKAKVQGAVVQRDMLRLAYLTQPFKDKSATWQLFFFVQNVLIFFAGWVASSEMGKNGGMGSTPNAGGWQSVGIVFIAVLIIIMWAMHSLVEPWESAYQNAASSRLYACHIVTIGVSGLWNAYYNIPTHAGFFEQILLISICWVPLLTIVYLMVGLRANRDAAALTNGYAIKFFPVWIRGMRWEQMPIPAGTVAIPCLFDGTPTYDTIAEALKGSTDDSGADGKEERRTRQFKKAFERLLEELSGGTSGSNVTSQVRRYGADAVAGAQHKSLDQAKLRVLARLEQFKQSMAPTPVIPPFVPTAPAAGAPGEETPAIETSDIVVTDAPASDTTLAAPAPLLRRGSSKAMHRAATLTKELADVLESEGEQLALELSPDEMALLRKLSKRGDEFEEAAQEAEAAEEAAASSSNLLLGMAPAAEDDEEAGSPGAAEPETEEAAPIVAETADAEAAETNEVEEPSSPASPPPSPPQEPQELPSLGDTVRLLSSAILSLVAEEAPPSWPSPPPSPPEDPAPPTRSASRAGLADGTLLTRGASNVGAGLADATAILTRGASAAGVGLADATTTLSEGQSAAGVGLADSTTILTSGQSAAAGLADGLATGQAVGLVEEPMPPGGPKSGIAEGTVLAGGKSRSSLTDGTVLTRRASAAGVGLADATTTLSQGQSAAGVGLADSTTVLTQGQSAAGVGLADSTTILTSGQSAAAGLADGLATGQAVGLVEEPMPSGGPKSGIADGTVLKGSGTATRGLAEGTVLARGKSRAIGLAAGTALEREHSEEAGIAGGTVLERIRRAKDALDQAAVKAQVALEQGKVKGKAAYAKAEAAYEKGRVKAEAAYAKAEAAYEKGRVKAEAAYEKAEAAYEQGRVKATAAYDKAATAFVENPMVVKVRESPAYKEATAFVTKDLLDMQESAGRRGHVDRSTLSDSGETGAGARRTNRGAPLLEREPSEPPEVPDRRGMVGPASGQERMSYLISLVEWLISPAQDISQAKEMISPWPAKANRAEPGDEQLDEQMKGVLHILEMINYGTGGSSMGGSEREPTRPLIEIGYLVVLCVHHHRNARSYSSRAAQIRQRWYLTVIDWQATAKANADSPLLVMPNTYLKQWTGRRVRVKEPLFVGGVYARGSDKMLKMVREGNAVIYDEAATSIVVMPAGVRVKILHRTVQNKKASHNDDLLWSDIFKLVRNLRGEKTKMPFNEPLHELRLDVGATSGMLLEDLTYLVEDLMGSSGYGELGEARALANVFRKEMRDVVHMITNDDKEEGAALGELAKCGQFPKIINLEHFMPQVSLELDDDVTTGAGPSEAPIKRSPGVSVHLCATDTRRLAPDASREIVVWLAIVDLTQYNPVNAASGGFITPRIEPMEPRQSFLVPGELACPASPEEIEKRLEAEERRKSERMQRELTRRQSSRIQRARSASSRKSMNITGLSARDLFKSEASLAAAAASLAESEMPPTPSGPGGQTSEGPDDVLDAMEAAEEEAASRRARLSRMERVSVERGRSRSGGSSGDLASSSTPEDVMERLPDRMNYGI
jgi:hypothetical protein